MLPAPVRLAVKWAFPPTTAFDYEACLENSAKSPWRKGQAQRRNTSGSKSRPSLAVASSGGAGKP